MDQVEVVLTFRFSGQKSPSTDICAVAD